jgi:hypothetical protein
VKVGPFIYPLNCPETKIWKEKYMEKKYLMIKKEMALFENQGQGCIKTTNLRNLGVFSHKVRCKWEHHDR